VAVSGHEAVEGLSQARRARDIEKGDERPQRWQAASQEAHGEEAPEDPAVGGHHV
jgi:hypothetical protein